MNEGGPPVVFARPAAQAAARTRQQNLREAMATGTFVGIPHDIAIGIVRAASEGRGDLLGQRRGANCGGCKSDNESPVESRSKTTPRTRNLEMVWFNALQLHETMNES